MNGKCKQRGATVLCMDQVDNCECTYAYVYKCEQIHAGTIACVSKHTCVHLNVFVYTVCMNLYACLSVISSLKAAAAAESTEYKDPL